jgi:malate-CoA ligase subunit alpha
MAILITETTRVIVQGMSGRIGAFHAADMIKYGTNVVGGVTPGKGGDTLMDRPLFNTVRAAVEATGAEASLVFVPPPFAADAIMEAADAGIRTAVCVTDGIPSQDMMKVKRFLRRYPEDRKLRLIGPNCAGIISPGKGFMGIMPPHIYMAGRVGIVGRSGTLGYEAAAQMKTLGIGVSTSVGIGGDPVNGSSFRDILALFEADPETDAVMLIGEIGGPQEAEAGTYEKAGGGLYRRSVRAQGPQDGPCRGDHQRLWRKCAGKGRNPECCRDNHRAEPVVDGRNDGGGVATAGGGLSHAPRGSLRPGAMPRTPGYLGKSEG